MAAKRRREMHYSRPQSNRPEMHGSASWRRPLHQIGRKRLIIVAAGSACAFRINKCSSAPAASSAELCRRRLVIIGHRPAASRQRIARRASRHRIIIGLAICRRPALEAESLSRRPVRGRKSSLAARRPRVSAIETGENQRIVKPKSAGSISASHRRVRVISA